MTQSRAQPPYGSSVRIEPPDVPELSPLPPESLAGDGELTVDCALVDASGMAAVRARRIKITESELRGIALGDQEAPGIQLRDVFLIECDLSNLDAREGSIRRVQFRGSRLVGFGLAGGEVRDLTVVDSSLKLASFAFAKLRDVIFERVDLAEASFMEAKLDGVHFVDCQLRGADFRGATTSRCTIRGASLDGVIGVESLRGTSMPWDDVLASAAALAAALGIAVEPQ